jgi:antitoxin MazE
MEVQIKPWGNSQGIRLPKAVLNEAGFLPDDNLAVKAENGRIVLYRSPKHKTLEERAAEYGGKLNLDGEMDWRGDPVGNEVW